tara:strand:+ start:22 stop:471 length:450 start_codon:yes stop_codon:yes gene_type:complete
MRKDLKSMAMAMGKIKNPIKLVTYEASYTDAVANKWKDKGGKAAYIKAAKAYNEKKYGTTEPTKVSNKITGGSKTRLAKANIELTKPVTPKTEKEKLSNPELKVSSLKKKPGLNVDTQIKAKKSKKEQRKSNRSERQNQREVNRALKKQ